MSTDSTPEEDFTRPKASYESAGSDHKKEYGNECLRPCEKTSPTKSANIPITKNGELQENPCPESIKCLEKEKTIEENGEMPEPTLLSNCLCKNEEETENICPTASTKVQGDSLVKDQMLNTSNGDELETVLRERDIKVEESMNTPEIPKDSKCGSSTVTKQSQKLVQRRKPKLPNGLIVRIVKYVTLRLNSFANLEIQQYLDTDTASVPYVEKMRVENLCDAQHVE